MKIDTRKLPIMTWEADGDHGTIVGLLDEHDEPTTDLDEAATAIAYSSRDHGFMAVPMSQVPIKRWDRIN